ncbi:tetratricopeptide repeat protein [Lipingzhangella sp. LS1_29]|uniref:Tetratricopeptide repeat protein n=1 Tax=Lipingzhangella rawalii TaxID=2055835 RepID=A0ABU2H766_9ACTN|nr:tetratricopeptide repeat protein [Lipingzhangella rawalii]MDS1271153.1 tetratricopeptide repeat protein [Lipingzhangella rawalii]
MSETTYETYARAQLWFELGDPAAAARLLAPLAEEEPYNRSLLELLGRSYFHAAQLRKAEDVFRLLIDLDPADDWAHIALARALERQSRDDEANRYRRLHSAMAGGSLD